MFSKYIWAPKMLQKSSFFHQKWASRFQCKLFIFHRYLYVNAPKNMCTNRSFFHSKFMFFPLQNHRFLRSRCIYGLQKLNKSCKKSSLLIEKSSFFDEKSTCSPLSICKWSKKDVQKSFIFHSKFMFFFHCKIIVFFVLGV